MKPTTCSRVPVSSLNDHWPSAFGYQVVGRNLADAALTFSVNSPKAWLFREETHLLRTSLNALVAKQATSNVEVIVSNAAQETGVSGNAGRVGSCAFPDKALGTDAAGLALEGCLFGKALVAVARVLAGRQALGPHRVRVGTQTTATAQELERLGHWAAAGAWKLNRFTKIPNHGC